MHKFASCAMLALATTLSALATTASAQDLVATDRNRAQILPGQPAATSPATTFSDANLDEEVWMSFNIVNESQTTPLNISSIDVSGPDAGDFWVSGYGNPLQPGESTEYGIRFKPTAYGQRNATVTINSNDPDQPSYSFDIRGFATLDPAEKPNVGLYAEGVSSKTNKKGVTKLKTSAAVYNTNPVDSDPVVVTVYRSDKPYFDSSASLVGLKNINKVKGTPVQKAMKLKRVKFKLNSEQQSGYLFFNIVSASPSGVDSDWSDNGSWISYGPIMM